jgi:dTDP-4-amino-4,6-dideoxygalactose transaminase
MNIPMVDLEAEYALLRGELEPVVLSVLAKAQYVNGPNVRALEAEIAAYCGVRHAVAVASGTDALFIALSACGVGPGDEVITTPFSFVASASTITMCGAKPVFADIEPDTFNLDPGRIEAAITPATRAIVPVHVFGQPAELAPMATLCRRHGLRLIEDAAHAFGAEYAGRKAGGYGHAGCLSFYPSKNLGAFGDGGMIVTDDPEIAARARALANHGEPVLNGGAVLGYNSRLDELQAAILRVKLRHLDAFNARRRANAEAYHARLAGSGLVLPVENGTGPHVYHQYTLRSPRRDAIRAALEAAGIASAIYYPVPLHRRPMYAGAHADVHLPVAERAAEEVVSLPMSPTLAEPAIDRIAAVVLRAHERV